MLNKSDLGAYNFLGGSSSSRRRMSTSYSCHCWTCASRGSLPRRVHPWNHTREGVALHDACHEKTDLKSLSLSYQKKDGRAWLFQSFFWYDKDLKVCFLVTLIWFHRHYFWTLSFCRFWPEFKPTRTSNINLLFWNWKKGIYIKQGAF